MATTCTIMYSSLLQQQHTDHKTAGTPGDQLTDTHPAPQLRRQTNNKQQQHRHRSPRTKLQKTQPTRNNVPNHHAPSQGNTGGVGGMRSTRRDASIPFSRGHGGGKRTRRTYSTTDATITRHFATRQSIGPFRRRVARVIRGPPQAANG